MTVIVVLAALAMFLFLVVALQRYGTGAEEWRGDDYGLGERGVRPDPSRFPLGGRASGDVGAGFDGGGGGGGGG
ncbi:hypothetical protein ACI79J_13895 [Geodermatophilus sp. SYSU D01062]